MAHENTDLFSCITPRKNGVNYSVSVREQKYTVQIVWIETPTNPVCDSVCLCVWEWLSTLQIVWIETPTNPTMKVVDIAAIVKIAHQRPGVSVVVDNTFMSSYFQVSSTLCHQFTHVSSVCESKQKQRSVYENLLRFWFALCFLWQITWQWQLVIALNWTQSGHVVLLSVLN